MLHLQAQMWRFLMGIGMFLHKFASPRPPKPSFVRSIPSTVSTKEGNFNLHFYVPKEYENKKRLNFPKTTSRPSHHQNNSNHGYPCIINFHGGGFTLGDPTDDARWCGTVVEQLDAVVVSVDYRRAPENPFPIAVEDGVDAVLYVGGHAESLGIDPKKIALSGFSSGANMAFTVPLRLYDHITSFNRALTREETNNTANTLTVPTSSGRPQTLAELASASATSVNRILRSRSEMAVPQHEQEHYLSVQRTNASAGKGGKAAGSIGLDDIPAVQLCAIVPWYPSCDYTQTRDQRRSTTVRKDQELPALFTDLFDESYLHPPDTIPLDSPYLSPGIADTELLREALPQEIIMHTCEWDMLLAEGIKFKDRLMSPQIGKKVTYIMVEGVPHGWDKAPNPIKPTPGVKEHYFRACRELRRVFADTQKNSFGAGAMNMQGQTGIGGSAVSLAGESAVSEDTGDEIEMVGRAGRRESRLVN